ncbi:MAG TPA: cysteine desulfurase, partial [Thermoanaerobaculia bacterium]|nr:cysteine desulfurase [Thermoanaerobaculia bacterium]
GRGAAPGSAAGAGAAEVAAARLAEAGIVVAQRAGRLRLSPHVYNSEDEVDRAVAVLAALQLQIG